MKYSVGFKQGVLKKVLPPESRPISEVSKETGLADQTIRNWMERARNGTMAVEDGEIAPGERRSSEKLRLVIESKSIQPERMGEWLREKGLHSEHIPLWEQELTSIVADKDDALKHELQLTKKKIKETTGHSPECADTLAILYCGSTFRQGQNEAVKILGHQSRWAGDLATRTGSRWKR